MNRGTDYEREALLIRRMEEAVDILEEVCIEDSGMAVTKRIREFIRKVRPASEQGKDIWSQST